MMIEPAVLACVALAYAQLAVAVDTVRLYQWAAPLLAVAWSTSNCIVFHKSWDHFILPLPFGHGALIWSDPIAPPAMDASDAEIEAVRLRLEAEMNRIAAEADRIAGVPVIEPAPLQTQAAAEAEPAET